MQLRTAFWALLLAAVLLTLLAVPASAQISTWSFGGAFNVGGAHFRIGFAELGPYSPSYYFEVARPVAYPGYACSDRCYRRGNLYYHHPDCAVVNHHFRRHGYAPERLIGYYAPPVPYYQPTYRDHYARPRWQPRHYCCDGHYRKGGRHHIPPGHYKKHNKKHYWHDDD